MDLFLFHSKNDATASLPTDHRGAEVNHPHWVGLARSSFPLKPAPFCKLFADLCSTIRITTFLFFSWYAFLFSFLPSTSQSRTRNIFSLIMLQDPRSLIYSEEGLGQTRVCCSSHPQSHVVSLLLLLVPTFLGLESYQNSSTHRFPKHPLRKFCFLIMLVVFFLIFALTDISSLSRIEKISCGACVHRSHVTSHLILQYLTTDSLRPPVQDLWISGVLPSPAMSHSSEEVG